MSSSAVTVNLAISRGGQSERVMEATELKMLLASVARLTPGRRAQLVAALRPVGASEEIRAQVELQQAEAVACPQLPECPCGSQPQRQRIAALRMPRLRAHGSMR